ncbi:nuclease-related domain-containing protein [Streptomyces marianii]|uniref:NERD domain-containing protein n=1 Tax=Streptomyces marianii TaxID=1817406 RepID=A0A5R9DRM3_9ACTN|nr:nuclease-related domain-containing protein [Streptomyces marianii]TLQ39237.1 NERD domain-containing protein [Streptomyces marianii]
MRHLLPSHPVPEHRYIERVLRHSTDSLVRLIAATSPGLPAVRDLGKRDLSPYGPWALQDVAWVSLALGSETKPAATRDDLAEIVGLYLALDDPITHEPAGGLRLERFLQRVTHQQGGWQESDYAQLSRSVALLQQTPHPDGGLEVIRPGWDHELLGCSLTDYVGLAELVWACATLHPDPRRRGRFAVEWYPARDYVEFDHLRSPAQVKAVLRRHFATTKLRLRTSFPAGADPLVRRYTHNPLRARPLVGGMPGGYLVPVPAAVLGKATPLGLYYTGGDNNSERGKAFTRDVGHLFERYVGRQLALLTDAEVHPEVEYKLPKKQSGKSVDWIVVFPDLVLLVEVKSTRPGEALRLGAENFTTILDSQFRKAFKQVDNSADRIRSGAHPEFDHIPRDRPMVGMVVTAEQFHQINTSEHRSELPSTSVPVTVTSIQELEDAVTITGTSLADVLRASAAGGGAALRPLFQGHTFLDHNAVLEQGWSAIPFARPRDPGTGAAR